MPFLSRLFPLFKIALAQTEDQKSKNPPYDSARRSSREKIVTITKAEFFEPIQDEYVRYLSQLPPEEIYDNYNPGPTNPDGSVNFECHCVSHLVASPCGFAFRKALTCQKAASKEEQEAGACAEEFMNFIKCAIDTQCFRRNVDGGEEEPDGEEK